MPRIGLAPATVTAVGAELADEHGFSHLSMGLVAERLGVKTPSLYKHVENLADLNQRIAVLAAVELGDALRDSLQGLTGRDALVAAAQTFRGFVRDHPGRYAATLGACATAPDDEYARATARVLESLAVVVRSYGVLDEIHALRFLRSSLHGFATLESGGGFQLATEVDESFSWLVEFTDRGLRATAA